VGDLQVVAANAGVDEVVAGGLEVGSEEYMVDVVEGEAAVERGAVAVAGIVPSVVEIGKEFFEGGAAPGDVEITDDEIGEAGALTSFIMV